MEPRTFECSITSYKSCCYFTTELLCLGTFFIFLSSTRPPLGLLPILGPLGSGTDATHQPSPAQGSWVVGDHGSNVKYCKGIAAPGALQFERSIYHTQAGFKLTEAE